MPEFFGLQRMREGVVLLWGLRFSRERMKEFPVEIYVMYVVD